MFCSWTATTLLTNGFRCPDTFSTGSANSLTQRYSIRMPMKTLGTVRDKDNRHLSRIEVVMVHELMEGKGEGSEFCVYCRGVSNRGNNE